MCACWLGAAHEGWREQIWAAPTDWHVSLPSRSTEGGGRAEEGPTGWGDVPWLWVVVAVFFLRAENETVKIKGHTLDRD